MSRQLTRNQSDALRHLSAVGGRSTLLEMPASQQTITALAQSGLVSVRIKLTQKARDRLVKQPCGQPKRSLEPMLKSAQGA